MENLSGTDRKQLIDEIGNAMQLMARSWKFDPEVWLGLNLTTAQLKCLLFIDYAGSTNFKNLSDALGVTPPSITDVIDRLVAQQLVSREENPENRRMQVLKTTEAGRTFIAKLTESRRNMLSSLLEKLTQEDLFVLNRIFNKLVKSNIGRQGSQG